MKNFKVTVSPMSQHITDQSNKNVTFLSFKDAAAKFLEICSDLNIDFEPTKIQDDGNYEAGGIGYDYRIELEELQDFYLTVDGEQSTLNEFLSENSQPDVTPLSELDIASVKALNEGESCFVGVVEIKRTF